MKRGTGHINTKKTHDEFLSYTTQLIYVAIRFKGQCGMFAMFNSEEISDDIIKFNYNKRKKYCSSYEELNLNEEICERLLRLTPEERLTCYQEARSRILIDPPDVGFDN